MPHVASCMRIPRSLQVPLVQHRGQGSSEDSSEQRQLPEFMFGKHLPDVVNRVLTEVAGAPFLKQAVAASSKGKRAASTAAGNQAGQDGQAAVVPAVDINELLQPKKKARKGPKRKAAPASAAQGGDTPNTDPATLESLQEDVCMAPAGNVGEGGEVATRARWWIDDMLGCLAHAAGGASS